MYKLGDAIIQWGEHKGIDKCAVQPLSDARANLYPLPRTRYPVAYLPHSCDEWIIGGPDEVRTLLADLQGLLVQLEK